MTDTPYADPKTPQAFRPFKRNPYGFKTKWNFIRIINVIIAGILLMWALNAPDNVMLLLRFVIFGFHAKYYIDHLYNIEDMEKTLTYWEFRWRELKIPHIKTNENVIVKFRLKNKKLQKYCPIDEIIVVVPGVMTLIKGVGKTYFVLVNGFPKKIEDEGRPDLEIRNKKFLDGLQAGRHFKSVTYTVANPKNECRTALEESAKEGEANKARDLHMQDLIQYIDSDDRLQSVVKFKYMLELGVCRDIKEAIGRFNSTIPGFIELLKYGAPGSYMITDPLEIWKIFEEMYDVKEAY